MKKTLILFVVLFCAAKICNAQYFNAGFRLGANFSQIDGDGMSGYNLGGLVGGLFVSYAFNSKWEGQFEMLYSQKGSERVIQDTSQINGAWDLFRINYIEVPVMVNYNLSKKVKLSGGLGGALMIGNHFESRANIDLRNVDFVTKGEFNGTVGAQYFFTPRFSVFGRFTYSLIGINKPNSNLSSYVNATAFYVYDGGLANNVISFGVYYTFLKGGDK